MADDYFLEALTGALQGVASVYVPRKQAEFQNSLLEQRAAAASQRDFDLFQRKLPLQEESQIRIDQAKRSSPQMTELVEPITGRVVRTTQNKIEKLGVPSISQGDPDREIFVRQLLKDLPELSQKASQNKTSLKVINRLDKLIKKGGVTGKSGQLKSILAGYPELISGKEIESLTDAQSFQTLSRLLAGPIRLDIVGSGPVSDYEQKLLQRVSGGGGVAESAAKDLLNFYRSKAMENVQNYNRQVTGSYNLNPKFKDFYQPIDLNDLNFEEKPPLDSFWSQ